VLQNQLFQIQKGSLVSHALTDLNEGFPRTLSEGGLAFDALLIAYDEGYDEGLLEDCAGDYLALDCEANLSWTFIEFYTQFSSIKSKLIILLHTNHLLTFNLIECGSVQTQAASTNLTLPPTPSFFFFNPLTLFKHSAINSRLSNSQPIHRPAS
jgi:hypothetical protein